MTLLAEQGGGTDPARPRPAPASIRPAAFGPASIWPAALGPASSGLAALGPAGIWPAALGPASIGPAALGPASSVNLPVVDGVRVWEPDRDQFDFWVGSWRVHSLVGEPVDGRNEICWTLDGKVLWEQFSAGTDPFTGWSFSVPVPGRGWVQTWVDNTGAYLDFVGGWLGDRMVLERRTAHEIRAQQPAPARQRMTWHSIRDTSFVWDWAHPLDSDDAGWNLMWRLHYDRL